MFQHSSSDLLNLVEQVLNQAKNKGATAADVDIAESVGQTVSVRMRELEFIEYQQDKALDLTIYVNQRKGRASTADFSPESINQTVEAALNIAKYTAEDDCSGLAEPELMATEFKDLDLFHPWQLSSEEATTIAQETENAALDYDEKISNSEGASVHTGHGQYVYGNTHGFAAYEKTSRHSISCCVLSEDEQGMYRDYWYDSARNKNNLIAGQEIGLMAAKKAIKKLGKQDITTGEYPVLFDARVATSLIGHVISAISGGALYRKTSFLNDSLNKKVLADIVNIEENPFIVRGLASSNYDTEGVATRQKKIIENGVVNSYLLASYSARKLGMQTTGNAGGVHNLILQSTHDNQQALLSEMGTGLLVTELMGQGVNMLTGDYSRGAAGFWVENGVIVHPVDEITIASTLQEMLLNIVGIGHDYLKQSSYQVGSILISKMTVAAK